MTSANLPPASMLPIRDGIYACADRALWLAEHQTLVIADLHLGYGWAQRRRGSLGPVRDDQTAQALHRLMAQHEPAELVLLGDVVHAPHPAGAERELIEGTLMSLAARTRLFVVLGNHDRRFSRDFANLHLPTGRSWSRGHLTAAHGDQPHHLDLDPDRVTLVGHHHPVTTFADASGGKMRYPVFVQSPNALVLPAFSPFATGTDVRRLYRDQSDFRALGARLRLIATTPKRVVDLGWQQMT